MNNKAIGVAVLFVIMLGCTSSHPQSEHSQPPSSPRNIRVTSVGKIHFSNDDPALVMEYETEIPIEDKESLRKEVDAIWERFQKDVEKAQVKSGVIRATHYESSGLFGLIRKGKGFGFVFTKDADGKWRLLEDDKKKK
jgi:hypothetical protein